MRKTQQNALTNGIVITSTKQAQLYLKRSIKPRDKCRIAHGKSTIRFARQERNIRPKSARRRWWRNLLPKSISQQMTCHFSCPNTTWQLMTTIPCILVMSKYYLTQNSNIHSNLLSQMYSSFPPMVRLKIAELGQSIPCICHNILYMTIS